MDISDTISNIMRLFSEEYGQKFTVSKSRHKIWCQMLEGFNPATILAAAYHLASTRPDWPPDIATMRRTVIGMEHGELYEPSAEAAWGHVWDKIKDNNENEWYPDRQPKIHLTDMEKEAAKQVGGLSYLSTSNNYVSDRSRFIDAFNALVRQRTIDRIALPIVKRLVDVKRPQLPKQQSKELPPNEKKPEPVDPSEVSAFVKELSKKVDLREGDGGKNE